MADGLNIIGLVQSLNNERTLIDLQKTISERDSNLLTGLKRGLKAHERLLKIFANKIKNIPQEKDRQDMDRVLNRIKRVKDDTLDVEKILIKINHIEKKKSEISGKNRQIIDQEFRVIDTDIRPYARGGEYDMLQKTLQKLRDFTNQKIKQWNDLAHYLDELNFYSEQFMNYIKKISKDLATLRQDLKLEKQEIQELKAFT